MIIVVLADAGQQATIIGAMRRLESLVAVNGQQCVLFRPRVTSDQNYIAIQSLSGCSSYVSFFRFHKHLGLVHVSLSIQVGRQLPSTNGQAVSLEQPGCIYNGTIMHELIHALGMLDVAFDSLVFHIRLCDEQCIQIEMRR